jgi:hypothetical protein
MNLGLNKTVIILAAVLGLGGCVSLNPPQNEKPDFTTSDWHMKGRRSSSGCNTPVNINGGFVD